MGVALDKTWWEIYDETLDKRRTASRSQRRICLLEEAMMAISNSRLLKIRFFRYHGILYLLKENHGFQPPNHQGWPLFWLETLVAG